MFSLSHRYQRNASWLVKLRWVAVSGQIATSAAAIIFFGIEIPMLRSVIGLISLTAVSNVLLTVLFRRWTSLPDAETAPWNLILGLILVMDLLSLAGLLYATGGPNNPFFLFFFVNLSLCALLLDRNWALAINGLTVLCFAGLLIQHESLPPLDLGFEPITGGNRFTLQHLGLLMAFSTCSGVIVYFMTRLANELREQHEAVRKTQALQSRSEKMEALGTLAAGAAHELATPLSTIAVVAKEVVYAIESQTNGSTDFQEVVEDVHLIRDQLARCRGILDRMAGHAGETIGESIKLITLEELARITIDGLMEAGRVHVTMIPESVKSETVKVPLGGLTQSLRCLVQNAIDADPTDRPIRIVISRESSPVRDMWKWEIHDRGSGMSPAVLQRVSEPFFTTKPPGKGMGLGVFLAQNVLNLIEGSIDFESTQGVGTCVTVRLPVDDSTQHN